MNDTYDPNKSSGERGHAEVRQAPIMDLDDVVTRLEQQHKRWENLLRAVLDAGKHHRWPCECPRCLTWLAVRKELRGE